MAVALTCFVEDKIQILLLLLKFSIALAESWNPSMPQDYLANTACVLKAQWGCVLLDLSKKAHDVAAGCAIRQNYGAELIKSVPEMSLFQPRVKQLQTLAYLHLTSWRQGRFRSQCQCGRATTTCSQLRCPATEVQLWLPNPQATSNGDMSSPLQPFNLTPPHLSLFCLCKVALRSPEGLDWGRGKSWMLCFPGKSWLKWRLRRRAPTVASMNVRWRPWFWHY